MEHRGLYLRFILTLLLISFINGLMAQDQKVVSDLHLWTGAAIEKSLGKDWTLSLGEEIRFKHNISEINNYFTEAGIRYRISKNFALEGGFRYTRDKKKDNTYENLSRYNLDLRYRGRIDFIGINYRLRYQKEVEGFKLLDQTIAYEKYLRHRIRISYEDFAKIKPYVSAETFQLFLPSQYAAFDYIRVLGGFKYEPAKIGSLGFAYGFNRELAAVEPATVFLIKVNYTYKF